MTNLKEWNARKPSEQYSRLSQNNRISSSWLLRRMATPLYTYRATSPCFKAQGLSFIAGPNIPVAAFPGILQGRAIAKSAWNPGSLGIHDSRHARTIGS